MAQARQGSGWYVPPAGWFQEDGPGERTLQGWFLGLAFALGAILRLYALRGQSLWVDEIATWQHIQPGRGLSFLEQIRDGVQGPLYMAVVWPLVRWQDPELMLRLPAALAGAAAVPLLGAWAASELGRRTGQLSALLLAINPFHIWYSQEGRGYSFLILLCIVAAQAYARLCVERPRPRDGAAVGLAFAAAMGCNLSALFLWAACGLSWLVLRRPRDRRSWWIGLGGFALAPLLASPWLLQGAGIWAVDRLAPGGDLGQALRGETTFSWLALPYTAYAFFFGFSLGPSLPDLHGPDPAAAAKAAWPWLAGGAAAAGVACVAGLRAVRGRRLLLTTWIAVPVLCLIVLALRNVKPWNARYAAVVFPWVLVLAAAGLAALRPRPRWAAGVVLIGLSLWSLRGYYGQERYAKEDVRSAAAFLTEANTAGDPVLAPVVASVFRYYYRGAGPLLSDFGEPALSSAAQAQAFLASRLQDGRRCWIVWARPWFFDPRGFLLAALREAGDLQPVHRAPGVTVFSWTRGAGD